MKFLPLVAALLAVFISFRSEAAVPRPLFMASEPINIVIQAPLSQLIRDRSSNAMIAGILTEEGGQKLPISLTLRGNMRRSSETCEFPPLRVRFTAPPPASSLFAGQKKLKLVTHCRNSLPFQQHVLLEYSAYKMYNILTPHSFRVRLANIDYRDSDGRSIMSRIGYFLEDLGEVAKRDGMKETHAPSVISIGNLNPSDAARFALFEDMISNHDWSMRAGPAGHSCCHNADLIGPLASGTVIPVPYDFDFSGLVDAPYASPPEELHISSVRDRVYRGYCTHNAEVISAAREFRDAQPRLIAAITSTPGLDKQDQDHAVSFVNGFFADISSDERVTSKLLRHCVN